MAALFGLGAARAAIVHHTVEPPPGAGFGDGLMSALGKAVGYDGYCLFGVDPVTGLSSVMFSRDGLEVVTERLVRNETVERDANRYQDLIGNSRHVGTLSAGTAAEPRSNRLHEMLRPQGYGSELRLALVSDGHYWGALSMFREGIHHPFTESDADLVSDLSLQLSLALRRYQIGGPATVRRSRPPGVLLFHRNCKDVAISDEAHAWLRDLAASGDRGGPTEEDLFRVTHEVATATTQHSSIPMCRGRMPDGSWLVVSGTRIAEADADVAVVLRSGDPQSIAPAFSAWCGLTPKQTQVLDLVVAGLPAKHIARNLDVSLHTVNDHLKAVYRKGGVRGREELLSLLW